MGAFDVVFFFQAEDGIRDHCVTGVQTCALPIFRRVAVGYRNPLDLAGAAGRGPARVDAGADVDAVWLAGDSLDRRSARPCRAGYRSEERRVGKECTARWAPEHVQKKRKRRTWWC